MRIPLTISAIVISIFANAQEHYDYISGSKQYELTNHLGNVLATISDKKLYETNSNGILKIKADILSANDYYPFGMQMDGRSFTLPDSDYKFGFNGKESDDEVSGSGNQYDYGFRIYNPRIAKFLSVDPLTNSYPWYTPYQFAGNKPIHCIDLDGLEEKEAFLSDDFTPQTLDEMEKYTRDEKRNLALNLIRKYENMDYKSNKDESSMEYAKRMGIDPDFLDHDEIKFVDKDIDEMYLYPRGATYRKKIIAVDEFTKLYTDYSRKVADVMYKKVHNENSYEWLILMREKALMKNENSEFTYTQKDFDKINNKIIILKVQISAYELFEYQIFREFGEKSDEKPKEKSPWDSPSMDSIVIF